MNDLIKKINESEESLIREFSVPEQFSKHLVRYKDDALKDMRDLNYFEYETGLAIEEKLAARTYQVNRKDDFCKFHGKTPMPECLIKEISLVNIGRAQSGISDLYTQSDNVTTDKTNNSVKNIESVVLPSGQAKLEEYVDFTMCLGSCNVSLWNKNTNAVIKDIHSADIYDDLIKLEVDNFGEAYGADFAVRKTKHWLDVALNNKKLNFYGAYIDEKICGSLYTYNHNGCVGIDGLNVAPLFRNQYVATTLLSSAILSEEGTIFYLHAEEEDTPKDIYKKLGFVTIDKTYWYSIS